ncbi:4134_t:CDS:2, partial [Funneliformis mosseae]
MTTKPTIKAFFIDTTFENWTCINMIEYYYANSGYKNLQKIMDCIKKDLQGVANTNSEFEIAHKKKARDILDDWKNWSTQRKNPKRSSGVNIESLQDQPTHTPPHRIFSSGALSDAFIPWNQQQRSNEGSNGQGFSDSERDWEKGSEQTRFYDNIPKECNPEDGIAEDDLLMRSPSDITADCKLTINNICIRTKMEQWCKSTKYVEEIHKQDTIEGFLTSPSTTSSSISVLADQDTEHDGRAEEIKQYLNDISRNNTIEKLHNTVKTNLLIN